MSRTSDLAQAYMDAASDLDQLYLDLSKAEQYGLANQVAQAESNLKQAASTLLSIDIIDQFNNASQNATTIENLTTSINNKAAAIQTAENRVTLITGLATTLLTLAGDFSSGNISGGIAAAGQAISTLQQL